MVSPAFLDGIAENRPNSKGLLKVIAGPCGTGKSWFACKFNNPIVVTTSDEDSVEQLQKGKAIGKVYLPGSAVTEWSELITQMQWLLDNVPADKINDVTPIFDSVTSLAQMCYNETLEKDFGGDMAAFGNYGAGYVACRQRWEVQFLDPVRALRDRCKRVICICHTEVRPTKDVRAEVDVIDLRCPVFKHTAATVVDAADIVALLSFNPATNQREISMHTSGFFSGKNPYSIGYDIPAGNSAADAYVNYVKAISHAVNSEGTS